MANHAKKWIKMLGKDPDDPDDIWDCFMMEASYDMLGGSELEIKVREREPTSFHSLLEIADVLAEAKRTSQNPRHHGSGEQDRAKREDKQTHKPSGSQPRKGFPDRRNNRGCYSCGSLSHHQAQCPSGRQVKIGFVL